MSAVSQAVNINGMISHEIINHVTCKTKRPRVYRVLVFYQHSLHEDLLDLDVICV